VCVWGQKNYEMNGFPLLTVCPKPACGSVSVRTNRTSEEQDEGLTE
jgi:hypothetical protein